MAITLLMRSVGGTGHVQAMKNLTDFRNRLIGRSQPPGASSDSPAINRRKAALSKPVGYIDFFRDGQVVGWAYDPAKVPIVGVYVDDVCVGIHVCDETRQDVIDAGYPDASRGFRCSIPTEYFDGDRHELKVNFVNGAPLLVVTDLGTRDFLQFRSNFMPEFLGNVDRVEGDIVTGWLLTGNASGGKRAGGGKMAIYCDGVLVGQIRANESRPDVGDAYSADPNCGFSFQIPARWLKESTQVEVATFPHRWRLQGSPITIERLPTTERGRLRKLERDLGRLAVDLWRTQREIRTMTMPTLKKLSAYGEWAVTYFPDLEKRAPRIEATVRLKVSVLCPVYRPRLKDFVAAVESVIAQTYPHWELIVVDDASGDADLTTTIDQLAGRDKRIKVVRHRSNQGISDATNTAIAAATGDLIAFFDHDDLMVDCALDYMVDAIVSRGAKMAYSDEDKIDDRGRLSEPNFKSDWNLRLMLAQNYVCHLLVARREHVLEAGPFSAKYNGAQDHDFILRLSEVVPHDAIVHVPEVLYHWRKTPNSTAETISNKSYAIDAGVAVVSDYLVRTQTPARVTSRGAMTNYVVEWPMRSDLSVSIIVPFKDNIDLTRRCLKMLRDNTDFPHFEIVLVNNFSLSSEADDFILEVSKMDGVRVLDVEEPFNYSRLNNIAVAGCTSDLVLFLNNDVFVGDRTWLAQLVGELTWRDDVGAVGCKLLYENGTVQHAGVVLGVGDGGVAEHPFRGLVAHDPGFMGRALCTQEYSAVTAACLLTRRAIFDQVGGFDEADLTVAFNDVDLCLKIGKAGFRIVWRAETMLEHRESASRSSDMSDDKLPRFVDEHHVMHERWGDALRQDRCYNRNFALERGVFTTLRAVEKDHDITHDRKKSPVQKVQQQQT